MIRDGDVLVTTLARGFDHFLRRVLSIAPSRVHVKIALNVRQLDDVWKLARGRRLHFSLVFTQDGRNERQAEFFEYVLLVGAGAVLVDAARMSMSCTTSFMRRRLPA